MVARLGWHSQDAGPLDVRRSEFTTETQRHGESKKGCVPGRPVFPMSSCHDRASSWQEPAYAGPLRPATERPQYGLDVSPCLRLSVSPCLSGEFRFGQERPGPQWCRGPPIGECSRSPLTRDVENSPHHSMLPKCHIPSRLDEFAILLRQGCSIFDPAVTAFRIVEGVDWW